MKITIAGAGEVGNYLAKMLSKENHNITVIDTDEERLQSIASTTDLLTVHGSSSSFSTLEEAGISKAELFIAVTYSEEINLLSAILAKRLGAEKTVARVDNVEYIHPLRKLHFINLGIDRMIYPEQIAAKEIIDLTHQTGISQIFEFSSGRLSLFVIRLDKDAPIINKTLREAAFLSKSQDYRAVAITRGENQTIIPKGDDKLLKDDVVYVITNPGGVKTLLKYSGKQEAHIENVMILGGSRMGQKVARKLENHMNVKIIELEQQKSEHLAGELQRSLVIHGDGRNMDLLTDESISEMDAFIAVTDDSETNVLTCMLAKKFGVPKTIAEIENLDYIDIAKKMGIDSVVNKKLSAASHIYTFTMNARVSSIKCLTGTNAEVLEFVVGKGSRITKTAIKDAAFPKDALIGGVIRNNKSFIATGDTQIRAKDKVVVFALPSAIYKVEKYFS